ncbi:response regulator [Spirosoma aerophilum]
MAVIEPSSTLNPEKNYPEKEVKHPLVIMVDDDAEDFYLLTSVLKDCYPTDRVIPIYDSSQVVAKLDALPELPAFLLIDLNMPLKNGFEVIQDVRSLTRYAALPIVVFTSSSDPADSSRCQAIGATDYIQKPTSYKELHLIVKKIWGSWLASSCPSREQ